MGRYFPLPAAPGMAEAATRWLAGERWEAAAPRRASTVMLVRDRSSGTDRPMGGSGDGVGGSGGGGGRANGTEVFMLRRVAGMAFAPSTMVFPGGGVDARDGDVDLPWAGPSPAEWADLLGCSASEAQMYVAAAVREVFEECGVLLASPSVDGPLAQVDGERWRQVRSDLVSRASSLGQVLADNGLVLRSDLIAAKAHWLTPVFEPRRFDTWFFAALMPPHQLADGDTSEADEAGWVVPDALLGEYAAGSALMLPPTVVCVEQIRDAGSAAEFVMHTEQLPLIMPEVVDGPAGPAMVVEQLVEPAESVERAESAEPAESVKPVESAGRPQ